MVTPSKENIAQLIAELDCDEEIRCQKARGELIKIGKRAVPALAAAADEGPLLKRWEALKALSFIRGDEAMNALLKHLADDDPGMRWVAAGGLLGFGEPAVTAVLKAVIANANSVAFRKGAHHFLVDVVSSNGLHSSLIEPVMTSLEDVQASLKAPIAAEEALAKSSTLHTLP